MIVRLLQLLPDFSGKRALSRLLLKNYMSRAADVVVSGRHGCLYRLPNTKEDVGFEILINGIFEAEGIEFILSRLKDDKTYVDIGANIGSIAIPIAKRRPDIPVVCVEASTRIASYLKDNLALNKIKAAVFANAIFNEENKVVQFYSPQEKYGKGSMSPSFTNEGESVRTITLDNLASRIDTKVGFIKIDIEGYEYFAFDGGRQLLTQVDAPDIYFEFNDWTEKNAGLSPGASQQLLMSLGYTIFVHEGKTLTYTPAPIETGSRMLFATKKNRGEVVFFHRKHARGNFSIEAVFSQLRGNLPPNVRWRFEEMQYQSKGVVRRILCCWQAWRASGDVNHITGDIHFIALFLPSRRTVLTIHDIGFIDSKRGLARLILKWFWIQLPVRHCAAITTVSETTRQQIIKFVPQAAQKTRVIYNPISPNFSPSPKPFRKECPIVLQIGSKPNKNIPRLIEALSTIKCELYCVGLLDQSTMEMLHKHKIKFQSFTDLTEQEMVDLYQTCDILVYASLVEGFGLPIVEANAVGRVVVTSRVSSMPEIAGESAQLVDPLSVDSIREGILKVIKDDDHREQLIKKGFENVRRFNTDTIANQYVELYQTVNDGGLILNRAK